MGTNLTFCRVWTTVVNPPTSGQKVPVWRRTRDEHARVYYWNIVTMETTWDERIENGGKRSVPEAASSSPFSYVRAEELMTNPLFRRVSLSSSSFSANDP